MIQTFFLTLFSAGIWGDLTTISCGSMVATGEEPLWLDFIACYLGCISHDYILFELGSYYYNNIMSYKYFQKKFENLENNLYINFYKSNKIIKFLKYKFNSNIFISIPILLGSKKFDKLNFIKLTFIINLFFTSILFFISLLVNLMILNLFEVPRIENLTGGVLSILSYLLYKFLLKLFNKN